MGVCVCVCVCARARVCACGWVGVFVGVSMFLCVTCEWLGSCGCQCMLVLVSMVGGAAIPELQAFEPRTKARQLSVPSVTPSLASAAGSWTWRRGMLTTW